MVEPLKEAATTLKAQGTVVMAIDGQARRRPAAPPPHHHRTAAPPHARAAAPELWRWSWVVELPGGAHARSCTVRASCAGGGTGTGDAVTRLFITPRLVWQVSGAVARQLGVRAYPTIMWLQLMDEGVTIAEHAGGRDAASLVAFAKAAPGMIEEGVAAQKAKEGAAEGGAAEGSSSAISRALAVTSMGR